MTARLRFPRFIQRNIALPLVPGFAVPISNPRYSATESQFTISPPKCCASASESAVLPLPVGPTMAMSSGSKDPGKSARAPRGPRRARFWRGGVKVQHAREAHHGQNQNQQRDDDQSQGLLARRLHASILADLEGNAVSLDHS